jgi:hypothetical protein
MDDTIMCGHCETPAVAKIDADYLCAGCLMSILLCLEDTVSITPVNIAHQAAIQDADGVLSLKHIYQEQV